MHFSWNFTTFHWCLLWRYGLDELSLYVITISQRQSHFLELNIHWMKKKSRWAKKLKGLIVANWEQRLKFQSLTLEKGRFFMEGFFTISWHHAHQSSECVFVIKLDLVITVWWWCHIWLIFVSPPTLLCQCLLSMLTQIRINHRDQDSVRRSSSPWPPLWILNEGFLLSSFFWMGGMAKSMAPDKKIMLPAK